MRLFCEEVFEEEVPRTPPPSPCSVVASPPLRPPFSVPRLKLPCVLNLCDIHVEDLDDVLFTLSLQQGFAKKSGFSKTRHSPK